jgi:ubiquinone/menaquinone biosynthesis C-methylase UbiE
MTTNSNKKGFVIAESQTEVEWLRLFGPLATEGMGGLFPERPNLFGINRILDIGCGPGDWVLEVAREHPDIEVIGVDTSQTMLTEAASHAHARGYTNARFLQVDATEPMDFPDGYFDLVNARTIVGFMSPTLWPTLLAECLRLLRPGGVFRDTEFSEGLTNSAAAGQLWGFYSKALTLTGRSYDPDGRHIGIVNQLPRLLRGAGYEQVQTRAYAIDHSAGTPAWEGWFKNSSVVFQLLKPFVTKGVKVTSEEEFDALYQQLQGEMLAATFTALFLMVTVWGEKPAAPTG